MPEVCDLLAPPVTAPLPLPDPAHRVASILAMMVVFWVTEALPLAVTALLGPVLAVLLTMLYWLWRVRIRRSLRGLVGVRA